LENYKKKIKKLEEGYLVMKERNDLLELKEVERVKEIQELNEAAKKMEAANKKWCWVF